MPSGTPFRILAMVLVTAACITGTASAASLGIDWRQQPLLSDNLFSGVTITPDGSKVFSGGSQLLVRSWDNTEHWGGPAGFVASMSRDGRTVVSGSGNVVTLYNESGQKIWSRNMNGQIRAVAVSSDGSFVLAADSLGNYHTWNPSGEFIAMNRSADQVKRLALAPTDDYFVVTTTAGIRYYSLLLRPLWADSREGSLDEYIVISDDGRTVITAGDKRLSSHMRNGTLNWQAEVTKAPINDVACTEDCSLIITASQDNTVRGIDRYGKIHWEYDTGQWANAVAMSRTGDVIAAGANDGTLSILDHSGSLLTKRDFGSRLQLRTLGVSRNGTLIVVADQYFLYGLHLTGIHGDTSDTQYAAPSIATIPRTTAIPQTVTPTEIPVTNEPQPPATTVPAATTKQSPLAGEILLAVLAGGAGACLQRRR